MPEVTDTEVRIPNPRHPASDFDPDWFRQIPLDPGQGITALIGRLKAELPKTVTAIRTYVFARDKGWTMEKAQKWVEDHVKASLDENIKYEETAADGIAFATKIGNYIVNGVISGIPMAPKDTAWSFDEQDERAILGPNADDWENFKKAYLLVDATTGDTPTNKNAYSFPVCKMINGSLHYVWNGCSLVLGYLHGARGWTAPTDVKRALYSTLKSLYGKFSEEIEPLSLSIEVDVFDSKDGKLEEKDGLIWKQLLRVGSWPGEEGRGPIEITRDMLKDVKSAFDGDALPNVTIPVTHSDNPLLNSGFVKAVELREGDTELWVGLKFTEPEIEEKVRRGTIANVSAFVKKAWQDVKTGKVWPWALWHVALTNLPLVPNLKPFLASMGVVEQPCFRYSLGEEVKPMEKTKREEELEAQLATANGRVTQVEGELAQAKKGSETFKASIQAEQEKTKGLETELSKSKEIAASLQAEVNAEKKKSHDADVQSVILALQGKGKHDKVKMPDGYGFAPIVLQAVEPFLKSDEGNDIVLGIDGKKQSVTSTILSMLNAMAQAKDGVILSYSPHGEQDHRRPGNTPTEAEKDVQVDNYLKDRHLVSEVKK